MSSFAERKAARTDYYLRFVKGWKLETCSACAGSGHYDHDGAPACGGCDGTGKSRVPPATPPKPDGYIRQLGETQAEQRRFDRAYWSQPGMHIPKYRHDLLALMQEDEPDETPAAVMSM